MSEVMKSQELKKFMQTDSTSNICDKHEKRVKKPIYKMMVGGEEVCPICERDRLNDELSRSESKKIDEVMSNRNYNVFAASSLLTDIGLYDASFGTYEAAEPEEVEGKRRATEAFTNYKHGETFNTWLTGVPGVGKSHLGMSILRNLNESGEKDKQCLFVSVDEMLLRIRASFGDKESRYTEFYFVDLLSSVDYLVLDDLGAETGGTGTTKRATDFTLRVLYAIANGRQKKSTIVTTNLSRSELERMYDPKLVSRLMKDTFLIKFKNTVDKRIRNIEF